MLQRTAPFRSIHEGTNVELESVHFRSYISVLERADNQTLVAVVSKFSDLAEGIVLLSQVNKGLIESSGSEGSSHGGVG